MPVRSPLDLFYTLLAWMPVILVVAGTWWALTATTASVLDWREQMQRSAGVASATDVDAQMLMQALESGDTQQMSEAVDAVEARTAARSATPAVAIG
jgi:hypothetical protein